MKRSPSGFFKAMGLLLAGVAAFFLFLYVIGHDPDERPLSVVEYMIAGMLVAPGFVSLIRWSNRART